MAKFNYQESQKYKWKTQADAIIQELPEWTHEFFKNHCRDTHGYSERTVLAYATDMRTFFQYLINVNPLFKGSMKNITAKMMDQLVYQDLQDYISYVGAYTDANDEPRTNSATGKNRKVAALRSFYNYFYAIKVFSNNPASILVAPKIKNKPIVYMDRDETAQLLDEIDTLDGLSEKVKKCSARSQYRDKAIVTLLLGTGIRVSELVGISLTDISWKNRAIRIVRKGADEQVIYFNEDVEAALREYINNERKTPKEDMDALFVSQKGTRLTTRSVERMLKKYVSTALPQKHITPHKCRSSYASALYKANSDVYMVADALGHKSLEMAKKYAAIDEERRKEAANLVDWTHS